MLCWIDLIIYKWEYLSLSSMHIKYFFSISLRISKSKIYYLSMTIWLINKLISYQSYLFWSKINTIFYKNIQKKKHLIIIFKYNPP